MPQQPPGRNDITRHDSRDVLPVGELIAVAIKNKGGSMKLHQRGVDLLVNIMDAADHAETLTSDDMRSLLRETAHVLGELLKRDMPAPDSDRSGTASGN